ncbi:MAG: hypothetical protein M1825_006086 [Sarcosagium campestre]|nr:MAG: hypothetical protein M1825_006086 [Sarcosagium campestre]
MSIILPHRHIYKPSLSTKKERDPESASARELRRYNPDSVHGLADASELNGAFDYAFDDREIFSIDQVEAQVLHLPGHTPDHVGYLIGSNVFNGEPILNPDVGSARCDFPGGPTTALYKPMTNLLALPVDFRLYTGQRWVESTAFHDR